MAIVNSSRPDPIMKIYSVNLRYASSVRFDWLKKLEHSMRMLKTLA